MKVKNYLFVAAIAFFGLTLAACSDDDDNEKTSGKASQYDSHAVDLGLPSGTLWSDENIGANAPEEFGDYYAWGALTPYDAYTAENYTVDTKNIGADWSGNPAYDVVTVKYGGEWRTPTAGEFGELIRNTTKEWTTLNGVKGLKFTGANGKSIFLPAAGYAVDSSKQRVGFFGAYVTSTGDPGYEGAGIRGEINAAGAGEAGYYGFHGCSVRGVKSK